jgi:uncharacterized protein DUF4365
MSKRTLSQKIGAEGQKWFSAHVEENPNWLSRSLNEDFGIDLELELYEHEIKGDILKVQVKTASRAERRGGKVKIKIDRKYIELAASCRYPIILSFVCLYSKQAWYIWLQEWLLVQRSIQDPLSTNQKSWTQWVSEKQTIKAGLASELKKVAKWEGEVQLAIALLDTMRCAISAGRVPVIKAIGRIISTNVQLASAGSLNALISQAIELGNRLWNTQEGNLVAEQIFCIIRHAGNLITKETVVKLVLRGDNYSRVGINALSILYVEHFEQACSLELPKVFNRMNHPNVAFYCAFREAIPSSSIMNSPPDGFCYAGLKYHEHNDILRLPLITSQSEFFS